MIRASGTCFTIHPTPARRSRAAPTLPFQGRVAAVSSTPHAIALPSGGQASEAEKLVSLYFDLTYEFA